MLGLRRPQQASIVRAKKEGASHYRHMAGEWLIRVQGLRGGIAGSHNKILVWLQKWYSTGVSVKLDGMQ